MRDSLTKAAAYFWRFGYWCLLCAALLLVGRMDLGKSGLILTISAFLILFGLHNLVGLIFRLPSTYCEMQNTYRQPMTPMRHPVFSREMKRDCIFCGIFFLAAGICLTFFL
jgi:hypothetical protein